MGGHWRYYPFDSALTVLSLFFQLSHVLFLQKLPLQKYNLSFQIFREISKHRALQPSAGTL